MRKGSKFIGTEEELDKAIQKNLPLFVSDFDWLNKIKGTIPEEEFLNICESIAEAIDRGYIKNKIIIYDLMNGDTSFATVSTSEEKAKIELSMKGKEFLGL